MPSLFSRLPTPLPTAALPIAAGLGLGLSGYTVANASLGGVWWLGLVLWWVWLYRQTTVKASVWGTAAMALLAHCVFTLWLWGLHPLTWTGIPSWLSIVLTALAWMIWATLFALPWAGLASLMAWTRHKTASKSPWIQHFSLLALGDTLPWWFSTLGAITDLYVAWMEPIAGLMDWPGVRAGLPIVGANGLWALLIVSSGLVALAFQVSSYRQRIIVAASGLAIVIGLVAWPFTEAPKTAQLPPLVAVQLNLPIETIRQFPPPLENPYLDLLKRQSWPGGTWVLLPEEGVIHGVVPLHQPLAHTQLAALQRLADLRGWTLLTGLTSRHKQHYYNTLALLQPNTPVATYHKQHLVPFGETLPNIVTALSATPLHRWATRVIQAVGFPYIPEFTPGDTNTFSQSAFLQLWPTICFEAAVLPPRPTQPQLILNTSNLGWFHGSPLLAQQFLNKARLLAVYQHAPMLIAANTGPTAFITANGTVQQHLAINATGVLQVP